MTSTAALEPHMDPVIKHFCDHLERRFIDVPEEKREFDLGEWILFCKFVLFYCRLPALTLLF